jgi:hypothetical protein
MIAANARITELDVRRAERAANDATVDAEIHQQACPARRADMGCVKCHQLDAAEFALHTVWESLVRESVRQQQPAERVAEEVGA